MVSLDDIDRNLLPDPFDETDGFGEAPRFCLVERALMCVEICASAFE